MNEGIPHKTNNGLAAFLLFTIISVNLFLWSQTVFANDLGFIEAEQLNRAISDWVILDARPQSEWMAGHIPGALSFSWEDFTKTDQQGVPYRIYPPKDMAKAIGSMGIDATSPVVVYGDADTSWGGEGWGCWVLAWLGHKGPVRMLAGGIQSWQNNRFPVKRGQDNTTRKRVQYTTQLNYETNISTSDIERQKTDLVLIDTRSTLEVFRGKIPGAIHIPWDDFFTGKERRPLSPERMKRLLNKKAVDPEKTVVYYCTGGIRSAYAWFVHQVSGLSHAKNYEGGYEAWKRSEVQ